jgi:hypothetical protein
MCTKFFSENLKRREHLEDIGTDKSWGRRRRKKKKKPGCEQGPMAGSCKHGNECLGSTKGGEFLDQLSNYWGGDLLHGVSQS